MAKILIDIEEFKTDFPELKTDEKLINSAYKGVGVYISTEKGSLNLDEELHIRAVYLATAHIIYTRLNPDNFRQIASASEGGVSASFNNPNTKNMKEYSLSTTPYGMELLIILKNIQPPIPNKPNTSKIYYGSRRL